MAKRARKSSSEISNNRVAALAVLTIFLSSFGTYLVLDGGAGELIGAAVASGTLTITVSSSVGCTLTNSTVNFPATAPDGVIFSGNETSFMINNTGNRPLNISINSTAATTIFGSSQAVASDVRVKVGTCSGNTSSTGISDWTNAATADKRMVVLSANEANDTCELDFAVHIPIDEANATLTDSAVFFNCSKADDTGA